MEEYPFPTRFLSKFWDSTSSIANASKSWFGLISLKDQSTRTPSTTSTQTAAYEKLKSQRAWDLAASPLKQLPMQAIMLYMSGSSIQIFSIGIVVMLLFNPLKALSSINKCEYYIRDFTQAMTISLAFAPFAPAHSDANALTTMGGPKLSYVCSNLLTIILGLWKCNQMGLIPLGTADWLAFETRGIVGHRRTSTTPAHWSNRHPN